MSFQEVRTTRLDAIDIYTTNINGTPYVPAVAPVPACYYRLGVDPSSNPDPTIGGLMVTGTDTVPGPFNLPLTAFFPGLSIARVFRYDPQDVLSFPGGAGDKVTVNTSGYFQLSATILSLTKDATVLPNNFQAFQVLRNGQALFSSPPAIASAGMFGSLAGSPGPGAGYNFGSEICDSALVQLNAGDIISLVYYLLNTTAVVSLSSNLSITMVGVIPPGP